MLTKILNRFSTDCLWY